MKVLNDEVEPLDLTVADFYMDLSGRLSVVGCVILQPTQECFLNIHSSRPKDEIHNLRISLPNKSYNFTIPTAIGGPLVGTI
jgi:hypothetical protein